MLMWKKTSRVTPWGDNIFHFSETFYAGVSKLGKPTTDSTLRNFAVRISLPEMGKYIAIKQRKTPEKMMTVP